MSSQLGRSPALPCQPLAGGREAQAGAGKRCAPARHSQPRQLGSTDCAGQDGARGGTTSDPERLRTAKQGAAGAVAKASGVIETPKLL